MLVGFFTIFLAGSVGAESESVAAKLPAGNPYQKAFDAITRYTGEHDATIRQRLPLPAELVDVRREVAQSLADGRRAGSVDWGIDYTTGTVDVMPLTKAARMCRLMLETIDAEPSPTEQNARMLDVMALGRHLGSEQLFVLNIIAQHLEQRAYSWWEKNFEKITPDEARKIAEGIEKLPKGGSSAGALAHEKKVYLDGLLKQLADATTLLGEPAKPGQEDGGMAGLRMTGAMIQGARAHVGFETGDGSFWLEPGQAQAGVRLVSVNAGVDAALITYKGRSAWLKLSARQIAVIDLSRVDEALKTAPGNMVLAMLQGTEKTERGAEALAELERVLTQAGAVYEEARLNPERFTDPRAVEKRYADTSPVVSGVAMMVAGFVSGENKLLERREKFRARITERASGSITR
ncbi:MAG: hypothetical protein ABW223_04555 [Rariglobus sp.]